MIRAIAGVTLRAALGRRRFLLLIGLAAVPVLLALLVAAGGSAATVRGGPTGVAAAIVEQLLVRVLLPLIALILGTGVLGTEIEDGTAVYLLARPVERWRIVVAKLAVAAGLSAVLVAVSAGLTTVLIAGGSAGLGSLVIGYVAASAVGAAVYSALFLALSVITTRAFILGLVYTLLWEGLLAGLFEGTQLLSVREYVLGIASGLTGTSAAGTTPVAASTGALGALVVFVGALVVAIVQLASIEVRPAD